MGTEVFDTLLVDRAEGVVTVTLNRPDVLNAATDVTWRELADVCRQIAGRAEDRVAVFTGAGDAFCSGADLSGFGDAPTSRLAGMREVAAAAAGILHLPKPTIAKVNGVAVGAGANLALCCDLVVAADTARFCEIFSARGLSVDFGGSWTLPRRIGMAKAKELVLLAPMVPAAEALAMGLINKVVARADLDAAVAEWAARLAAGPPLALSLSKALLNDSFASSPEQALEAEGAAQSYNFSTGDIKEALAAWREKRPPVFTGR